MRDTNNCGIIGPETGSEMQTTLGNERKENTQNNEQMCYPVAVQLKAWKTVMLAVCLQRCTLAQSLFQNTTEYVTNKFYL